MAVDNPRVRARRELEELGSRRRRLCRPPKAGGGACAGDQWRSMESASYLVDDQPPGGWGSFATKDDLRVLAAELRAEMERGFKQQTWQLAKLVAGAQGIVVVVIAAVGVVLRFA